MGDTVVTVKDFISLMATLTAADGQLRQGHNGCVLVTSFLVYFSVTVFIVRAQRDLRVRVRFCCDIIIWVVCVCAVACVVGFVNNETLPATSCSEFVTACCRTLWFKWNPSLDNMLELGWLKWADIAYMLCAFEGKYSQDACFIVLFCLVLTKMA